MLRRKLDRKKPHIDMKKPRLVMSLDLLTPVGSSLRVFAHGMAFDHFVNFSPAMPHAC